MCEGEVERVAEELDRFQVLVGFKRCPSVRANRNDRNNALPILVHLDCRAFSSSALRLAATVSLEAQFQTSPENRSPEKECPKFEEKVQLYIRFEVKRRVKHIEAKKGGRSEGIEPR